MKKGIIGDHLKFIIDQIDSSDAQTKDKKRPQNKFWGLFCLGA